MFNVSFGSNYRFDVGVTTPDVDMSKVYNYELKGAIVESEFTSPKEAQKTGVYERVLVSLPNQYDAEIEHILANNGIKFQKQSFKQALEPSSIVNRIELSGYDAKDDCLLVDIDTEALNQLFKKNTLAYIEPSGTNGIGNRYKQVGEYLKTGKNIDATRVYLNDESGRLTASVQDGRHRFAYMRDMGIKKIPVALDNDSYKIALKYGLVK